MKDFIKVYNTLFLESEGFSSLTGKTEDGSSTLLEVLQSKAKKFPSRSILGAINKALEIEYMSYLDTDSCAKKLAQYLIKITEPGDIIGIASANRPEWLISEYATYYSSCINAPLYSTFKEDALSYILSATQMKILIASPSFAKMVVDRVINYTTSDLIQLKYIILMENDKEISDYCEGKGLNVISLNDILFGDLTVNKDYFFDNNFTICAKAANYFHDQPQNTSKSDEQLRAFPKPDDIATICFTSGTTGVPKGVLLTHSNFIAQIEGFEIAGKKYDTFIIDNNSLYFSCLPLSHVFERVVIVNCISTCSKICFFRGDKNKIGEDIKLVQPTFIAAVPKILESFYLKIEENVSKKKFYERFVYRSAVSLKIFLQKHNIHSVEFLDKTIFKPIHIAFGGKIKDILCGGASIDPYLIKYLRAVLGANIFQGYGQTEGLGANIVSTQNMNDASSVGIPFPSTRVKLESIENGPNGASPEKALFLRGPAITKGYFIPSDEILNKLLATGKFKFSIESIKESPFDEDGWLITGDVVIYQDKKFYIIGRTKDLVKLHNGEYISPENIENKLKENDLIKDLFISKIKGVDRFVALVSAPNERVDMVQIAKFLKNSLEMLVSHNVIPKCVVISHFAVVREDFAAIDDGILFTPTLKKKRFVFNQRFGSNLANAVSIDDVLNRNLTKIPDSDISLTSAPEQK